MPSYIEGSAHVDERGKFNNGNPGDQKQKGSPDYSGEVSMTTNWNPNKDHHGNWLVARPADPAYATLLANKIIAACNNPNVGYSMNDRAGIRAGIDATHPVNCDCSSLLSQAVNETFQVDIGLPSSSGMYSVLTKLIFNGSAAFIGMGKWGANVTELFNGDVMICAGQHVCTVVGGNPRSGQADTDTSGAGAPTSYVFRPRTSAPTAGDKFFVTISSGGNSPFVAKSSSGLTTPSNAAYAWGRFSEALGEACKLNRNNNPGQWYSKKGDGYTRSIVPKLGAAICFASPVKGQEGFAGIVEEIQDSAVVISYCNDYMFGTTYIRYNDGTWAYGNYIFQGFIHNPGPNSVVVKTKTALESFIETALAHVGNSGTHTKQLTNIASNAAWSAAFVLSVAMETTNLINIVIPNTTSCSSIGRIGVLRSMGTWYDGPHLGQFTPYAVGDLVLFRFKRYTNAVNRYTADKCGIVVEVSAASFVCVIGDVGDKVAKLSYSNYDSAIVGTFRPQWSKVVNDFDVRQLYGTVQGLYTEATSKEDAAIREVGYISSTYQPSLLPSQIRLGVMNYTGLLGGLYSVFGGALAASTEVNADLTVQLEQVIENIQSNDAPSVDSQSPTTGQISSTGLELIQHYEGCKLDAYWDSHGKCWTIGWGTTNNVSGTTGFTVGPGKHITQAQADDFLLKVVNSGFATSVMKYNSIYNWKQCEFDALVSATYNFGGGNLNKLLRGGSLPKNQITAELKTFTRSGGKVLPGLVKRRNTEARLFETGNLTFD